MSSEEKYILCRFEQSRDQDTLVTVAWIPERGAKVGFKVELIGEDGLWTVMSACGPSVPKSQIRFKQKADRSSLTSLEKS